MAEQPTKRGGGEQLGEGDTIKSLGDLGQLVDDGKVGLSENDKTSTPEVDDNDVDTEMLDETSMEIDVEMTKIHEMLLSPEGRVHLLHQVYAEAVAPVEKLAARESKTLKELSRNNKNVKTFRKAAKQFDRIMREHADVSVMPTVVVMQVTALYERLHTLKEVIVDAALGVDKNAEDRPASVGGIKGEDIEVQTEPKPVGRARVHRAEPGSKEIDEAVIITQAELDSFRENIDNLNREHLNHYLNEDTTIFYREGKNYKGFQEIEDDFIWALKLCLPSRMSDDQKQKVAFGKFMNLVKPLKDALKQARNENNSDGHIDEEVVAADKALVSKMKEVLENTILNSKNRSQESRRDGVSANSKQEARKSEVTGSSVLATLRAAVPKE